MAAAQTGEKLIVELGSLEMMSLQEDIQYVGIKGSEKFSLRINEGLAELIAQYIMSVQWEKQSEAFQVLITRHGQSEYNQQDRIGGDSDLSIEGRKYLCQLERLVRQEVGEKDNEVPVMTSFL